MKTLLYAQSAQIAYFLGTIDLSDRLKVASMIKDEIGEVLDGTPTILPMPDDAPLEIPRIVLSSKDKTTALNVAVSRIDYIYKTSEGEQGIEIKEFQEDFISKVNAINKLLFDKLKATSYRLGLIINYQALLKEGGLGFLKTRFLGDPKDNSIEVQFHKRNQVDISGMKVNNWIRLIGLNQKV